MNNLIERALQVATMAHEGQMRRDGVTPYITHPTRLAARMGDSGASEIVLSVALLHDVIEDTDMTFAELSRLDIPPEAIEAIRCLTHQSGEIYQDYLDRVKPNPIARAVKIADILDNLGDRPSEKQIRKYGRALVFLTNP